MTTMQYEIEIAYRREQLMRIREQVGPSRRERRRQAALADGTEQAAATTSPAPAQGRRPVPTPRLG